jgi:hypothetical protein
MAVEEVLAEMVRLEDRSAARKREVCIIVVIVYNVIVSICNCAGNCGDLFAMSNAELTSISWKSCRHELQQRR